MNKHAWALYDLFIYILHCFTDTDLHGVQNSEQVANKWQSMLKLLSYLTTSLTNF